MIGSIVRWRGRVLIGVVGVVYFAALFFGIMADGGRDAALFYGIFGLTITIPKLLLIGKLVAKGVGKSRTLGSDAQLAVTMTPTCLRIGRVNGGSQSV